jgi:site-specific DNA-methyltransferase (adenine-specific)
MDVVNCIQLKKNINLIKELILDNTDENDIVFDPCFGSGCHLLAAKETNRKYIGCEIDKEFFEIGKNRLNN